VQDDEKILSKADEEDGTLILPCLPVSRRRKKNKMQLNRVSQLGGRAPKRKINS